MNLTLPSDALVFFGATGDLTYKKIFPALQSMWANDSFWHSGLGCLLRWLLSPQPRCAHAKDGPLFPLTEAGGPFCAGWREAGAALVVATAPQARS